MSKIALITGASRGIGQATAVRFAAEGMDVAIIGRGADNRSSDLESSLAQTAELARSMHGGRVHVVETDLGDPAADRTGIVANVVDAFGRSPDILVHSAAAPREFDDGHALFGFADAPQEWFARSVELNVWAYWDLAKSVIPAMRANGKGWLLAISSQQAAPRPSPALGNAPSKLGGASIYGGTKAFLDRITTGAAEELYVDNIAVNALAPTGPVRTPRSAKVMPDLPDEYWEPMETMVEAALALCTGEPRVLTSRIAYSLPLLVELDRPVRTLDGQHQFEGWQPNPDDPRLAGAGYLRGH